MDNEVYAAALAVESCVVGWDLAVAEAEDSGSDDELWKVGPSGGSV